MVVIILIIFFGGVGTHWKTDIKLLKIGMWTILQRIMSTLRHNYVTEPDVVWHEVKGTRYRIMWMGPCTEWCDKTVKYYARMFDILCMDISKHTYD